jgi:acyl-CoA thioester hydrolase
MTDIMTYKGTVYPWHCDHMGHMNVMWYVGKFDEAVWNLFLEVGITPSYLRSQNRGMVAVRMSIEYLQELRAGDVLEIRSEIIGLGNKAAALKQTMLNAEGRGIAARWEAIVVHIDTQSRKAVALPESVRTAIRSKFPAVTALLSRSENPVTPGLSPNSSFPVEVAE